MNVIGGGLFSAGLSALTGGAIDPTKLLGDLVKKLIEELMSKHDNASMKTVQDLAQQQQNAPAPSDVAPCPQPFSQDASNGASGSASGSGSGAGVHSNPSATFGILIIQQRDNTVQPREGGKLSDWDGTTGGWQKMADQAKSGLTGSPDAQQRILNGGKDPWNTADGNRDERISVLWAMQQNPNVRYDADKKEFFTKGADGSQTKVADLAEVEKMVTDNGGFDQNNATALHKVGDLLNGKISTAPSTSTSIAAFSGSLADAAKLFNNTTQAADTDQDPAVQVQKQKHFEHKGLAVDQGAAVIQQMISYTQLSSNIVPMSA